MSFSVEDLLSIPFFRNVQLVAGAKGTGNPIEYTGILDYEFAPGYEPPGPLFISNILLITSLLYAREDPDLILPTLKELKKIGISGLVYKPVLFDDLPEEALDYADRVGFPILKMDLSYNFEDFLYQVMDRILATSRMDEKEAAIHRLLNEDAGPEVIKQVASQLFPGMKRHVQAHYILFREPKSDFFFESLFHRPRTGEELAKTAVSARYQNGFFWLSSGTTDDMTLYEQRFHESLSYFGLSEESRIGHSLLLEGVEGLADALRQAYEAALLAKVLDRPSLPYTEMGDYRLLMPIRFSEQAQEYSADYLAPLLNLESARSHDFLETAIAFVKSEGDLDATASAMFCHKNTVRYRMNRLHELLDPDLNDTAFYTRLFPAVKLYLLHRKETDKDSL